MAVLSKEEFLDVLKSHIGDDNSDASIQFLEDMSDTYNDLENKANSDNKADEWKNKYEANDKMWREKYTSRFFNSPANEEPPVPELLDGDGDNTPKKFDDLFTEKEN